MNNFLTLQFSVLFSVSILLSRSIRLTLNKWNHGFVNRKKTYDSHHSNMHFVRFNLVVVSLILLILQCGIVHTLTAAAAAVSLIKLCTIYICSKHANSLCLSSNMKDNWIQIRLLYDFITSFVAIEYNSWVVDSSYLLQHTYLLLGIWWKKIIVGAVWKWICMRAKNKPCFKHKTKNTHESKQ